MIGCVFTLLLFLGGIAMLIGGFFSSNIMMMICAVPMMLFFAWLNGFLMGRSGIRVMIAGPGMGGDPRNFTEFQ